ncbi:hypothetical protein LLEC1_07364 [Akanthomyces lecanii]|uniref:Major facilitator superfamily (MFS) profile domain-containing protein n=1 Tax=Cordyceps confragosa TaxID=2714763 RepID=A0A179IA65_CORDF|nr:hypothetical protein LLEC1_07364 [Akanthomyces lecanii]
MAPPPHDPEKGHAAPPSSSSSQSDTDGSSPKFAAVKHTTTAGARSVRSRASVETERIDNDDLASSVASRAPEFEVIFDEGDPENPKNWPLWYRGWTVFVASIGTWGTTLYSSSYTASTPGLVAEFGASTTIVTLGLTTYLLGLAVGSLIVAPLSELYGRRNVYLVCIACWALLIVPSGVAHSLTTIIVVRFFDALFGSVMVGNAPGTVVDISHPDYLARTMSLFSLAPMNGPVTGPIIGGFVFQYLGWRWANWVILILGGVTFFMMLTVKETYAPAILRKKAARLRKENDDPRYWCQYDYKLSTFHLLKVNLSRPFILAATEPILWFMNVWISIVYAVLYLCFVAYPVVFSRHRGWSSGTTGLSFIGIGMGTLTSLCGEPIFRRIINRQPRDPETGKVLPEAQAIVMAAGSIAASIGQMGFSWTCLPTSIHWAVPIAFGIPFGFGNTIVFIYGSNYIAAAIRAKSRLIRQLREDQARMDAKRAKGAAKMEARRQRERKAVEQTMVDEKRSS